MTPRIYVLGFALLALIGAGIWLYTKGGDDNQTRTNLDNANDYIEGTQDARDATTDLPDDDAGNIDWLLRPWD